MNDHDTKSQTNITNNPLECSALCGPSSSSSSELSSASPYEHDPCVATSSTSPPSSSSCSSSVDQLTSTMLPASETLISSGDAIQTYLDEYNDGNFWTDPFFADIDAVNTAIMAPGDSDDILWSCMDLYSEYDNYHFMI